MKEIEYPKTMWGDPLELKDLDELAYAKQDDLEVTLYRSPEGQLFLDAPGRWLLVSLSEINDGDTNSFVNEYMTCYLASDR